MVTDNFTRKNLFLKTFCVLGGVVFFLLSLAILSLFFLFGFSFYENLTIRYFPQTTEQLSEQASEIIFSSTAELQNPYSKERGRGYLVPGTKAMLTNFSVVQKMCQKVWCPAILLRTYNHGSKSVIPQKELMNVLRCSKWLNLCLIYPINSDIVEIDTNKIESALSMRELYMVGMYKESDDKTVSHKIIEGSADFFSSVELRGSLTANEQFIGGPVFDKNGNIVGIINDISLLPGIKTEGVFRFFKLPVRTLYRKQIVITPISAAFDTILCGPPKAKSVCLQQELDLFLRSMRGFLEDSQQIFDGEAIFKQRLQNFIDDYDIGLVSLENSALAAKLRTIRIMGASETYVAENAGNLITFDGPLWLNAYAMFLSYRYFLDQESPKSREIIRDKLLLSLSELAERYRPMMEVVFVEKLAGYLEN